ncbi:related to SSU1 - plasma membrane sulfite pump [Melanopsichium pennsylvanicum]|uniref:Related to SSU1 - plasma membrane sulfite pump n=2 Tax=Melanopsichium pennsylvanicum TaxID=63383 RepID=A0AAJ5C8J8_9BASI|nr:c4-dicarboxylate transporter malic acid transport protein [Melanopsichium pennsylvanicum 4]SNX88082.1 related to SSU1 - plasma membrane sulfite pump [Melanopsichium pennsylvanicum]
MSSSRAEVYQDAPGLELQNDVMTSVEHAHPEASFSSHQVPKNSSTSATSSSQHHVDSNRMSRLETHHEAERDDLEAATGAQRGDVRMSETASTTSNPHALQHDESYGQRLTRVLTGDAEPHQTEKEDDRSNGERHRRKRLVPLLMRPRQRSGGKAGQPKVSRSSMRQRADQLARIADSEKVAQAQRNNTEGTTESGPSTDASSEPERIKIVGQDGKPMRRSGIKERVLHFTPSWFSVTMGTGVIATLLNLLPWPSIHSGLRYPAICFLLGDIVIFILFLCAFFARYLMYPQVVPLTIKHPQKSMFLGTIPMGLITIISGIAQLGTEEFGLGIGFAVAASGLWWAATALSLATAIGVPFSMMTYQKHYFQGITAALLLPVVPPITAAATGSVIAEILMHTYPTYAFTIMVVSYLVLGIGLPLALLILVLYFQRLLLFKSPPRDVIISVFLPLGPCGQGGEACLHLGKVALHLLPIISTPASSSGVPQLFSVGQALYGAGLISAMLLFGLGIWWLAIGLFTIVRELKRGKLGFNMGWWGLTFPFASLAICTARLAIELNSLTLKIVYTGFVIANISLWLFVAIPTARGAWTGRLFNAPCLADLPLKS